MNANPNILILTLSFGAGHVSAAKSIAAECQKQMPDAEIQTIDALENCPLWFRAFYVWTYWWMIRYAPRVWEKFFNSRVERRDEQTAPVWMWRKGCKRVFDKIENFQPDLIVAAEVGASEIAVIARRENLTTAAIVNVITDYEAEPIWIKPEIIHYCVAAETVKNQLENWGAKAENITVCGIPLDESFAERNYAQQTRARFDLDEKPLVLLMGGGMGPTRMDEVAAHLLKKGENLNIIALPGKDERAKAALGKLRDTKTVNLHIINWTNEVAALMRTASILATKPGGVTLSEAAACGLPLVLFDAIPGPETINAKQFVKVGAAVLTENSADAATEIIRLLADAETLGAMAENISKRARKNATAEIIKVCRRIIEETPDRAAFINESKQMADYRRAFALWRKMDEEIALKPESKI